MPSPVKSMTPLEKPWSVCKVIKALFKSLSDVLGYTAAAASPSSTLAWNKSSVLWCSLEAIKTWVPDQGECEKHSGRIVVGETTRSRIWILGGDKDKSSIDPTQNRPEEASRYTSTNYDDDVAYCTKYIANLFIVTDITTYLKYKKNIGQLQHIDILMHMKLSYYKLYYHKYLFST